MRAALARWLHRTLPVRGLPNNRLAAWAWRHAPDPTAPASVQAWWAHGGEGATIAPPRFRGPRR